MKRSTLFVIILVAGSLVVNCAFAQSTLPLTPEEREAIYSTTITRRTTAILTNLALSDPARSNAVQSEIIAYYRALRARDEAIDTMLARVSKDIPGAQTNRIAVVRLLSKPLHDSFIAKLAANLTPAQVEQVKDKMTYDKVKVTYNAYGEIIPGLGAAEKARILDSLKQAREEAMDGGTVDEKSAIFQMHKDKINEYLKARGYDVARATKDWEAKQHAAQQAKDSTSKTESVK